LDKVSDDDKKMLLENLKLTLDVEEQGKEAIISIIKTQNELTISLWANNCISAYETLEKAFNTNNLKNTIEIIKAVTLGGIGLIDNGVLTATQIALSIYQSFPGKNNNSQAANDYFTELQEFISWSTWWCILTQAQIEYLEGSGSVTFDDQNKPNFTQWEIDILTGKIQERLKRILPN
jgi:hypothetical protein